MPELARTIVGRLRAFIRDRRCEKRCTARLAVSVSLLGANGNRNNRRELKAIVGQTSDVSLNGLALIVPVIRFGDQYLSGDDHELQVRLELPTGPVEIVARSVRYERLDESDAAPRYLIGVRIEQMNDGDRKRYDDYVRSLLDR